MVITMAARGLYHLNLNICFWTFVETTDAFVFLGRTVSTIVAYLCHAHIDLKGTKKTVAVIKHLS